LGFGTLDHGAGGGGGGLGGRGGGGLGLAVCAVLNAEVRMAISMSRRIYYQRLGHEPQAGETAFGQATGLNHMRDMAAGFIAMVGRQTIQPEETGRRAPSI